MSETPNAVLMNIGKSLVCNSILSFDHENLDQVNIYSSKKSCQEQHCSRLTSFRDLSSSSAFFFCAICRPRSTCLPTGRRSREDSGRDSVLGSLVAPSSISVFLFLDFFFFFESAIEDVLSASSLEGFFGELSLDLGFVFDFEDFRFGSPASLVDEPLSSLAPRSSLFISVWF